MFTSYSWSANIVGRKRWVLFPPGEEINLKNDNGDLIYNETLDITDKDNNMLKKCVRSIEIIQDAGEVIFIPSGWHHQVWNLVIFLFQHQTAKSVEALLNFDLKNYFHL